MRQVAKFLQLELTEEEVAVVVKKNTFEKRKAVGDMSSVVKMRKGELTIIVYNTIFVVWCMPTMPIVK